MTSPSTGRSNRSCPGSCVDRGMLRAGRPMPAPEYPVPRSTHHVPTQRTVVEKESCECNPRMESTTVCVSSEFFPIGMTYTPMQNWENLYCPSKAILQGTLFADLDKPFTGRRLMG